MTDQLTNENSSPPPQTESDVFVLIKRMQQQLVFLEKKIDMLLNQSQEKPFREKHFSKPSRSFERPYRPGHGHDKRLPGEGARERSFHSGHHSEKRQGSENRGFSGSRKDYSEGRENSFSPDRHFKKKFDGKKSGFAPRKKTFFHKRKD